MKSLRIHCLQHVPFEGPGCIATWAFTDGHQLTYTRFYEANYRLPRADDIDFLIIMGGPMSVHDEYQYTWLHQEKMFIEDCIQSQKPVLGICLGAQLIATCLGARVFTATNKEIGWFPVRPNGDAVKCPWLYDLFAYMPTVFHWHGEKFDIPYNNSLDLLKSEANTNQAFLYNDRVLALQFHLECTPESINAMLKHCENELIEARYIQNQAEILNGLLYTTINNQIIFQVLDHLSRYCVTSVL